MRITYRPGIVNIVADTLLCKQEDLKTQKEKDVAAYTMCLVNPALAITTLDATLKDLLATANYKREPYELID